MSAAVLAVPVETARPAAAAAVPERHHLYWIDWMRFLAAATVLLDHICNGNWAGREFPPDPRYGTLLSILVAPIHLGREAVVVFFVLSGALVGGLTLNRVRAGAFDAAGYAADRLARIYVPLIPALLWTAASVRMLDDPLFPLMYLGCLFGLQEVVTHHPYANGALWSLSYEMWFYVFAGSVGVLAAWRSRKWATRGVALAAGVLALVILCFRLEWTYFGCWLLGIAGLPLSLRIGGGARKWVVAAGLALMFAGVLGFRPDFLALLGPPGAVGKWSGLGKAANLALGVGTVLVIAGVCRAVPTTRAGAAVERWGAPLAAFSYTLYLTHMPLLRIFACTSTPLPERVTPYSLFRAGWWAAASLAFAFLMYKLFEERTPQVRRWLRDRLGGAKGTETLRDQAAQG